METNERIGTNNCDQFKSAWRDRQKRLSELFLMAGIVAEYGEETDHNEDCGIFDSAIADHEIARLTSR